MLARGRVPQLGGFPFDSERGNPFLPPIPPIGHEVDLGNAARPMKVANLGIGLVRGNSKSGFTPADRRPSRGGLPQTTRPLP